MQKNYNLHEILREAFGVLQTDDFGMIWFNNSYSNLVLKCSRNEVENSLASNIHANRGKKSCFARVVKMGILHNKWTTVSFDFIVAVLTLNMILLNCP